MAHGARAIVASLLLLQPLHAALRPPVERSKPLADGAAPASDATRRPLTNTQTPSLGLMQKLLPSAHVDFDVMVRYGPIVFASRVLNGEEFEQQVRTLMRRHPDMLRAVAEQHINERLSEGSNFWRGERPDGEDELIRAAPSEADPPVSAEERVLVAAWMATLVVIAGWFAVHYDEYAARVAASPPAWQTAAARSATELLNVPADSLNGLFPD